MTINPVQLAFYASWAATAVGLGLWVWTWIGVKDPISRLRFSDCAVVLLFASILTRVVAQQRPMGVIDWAMVFLGPLFIAAALWRLARTNCPPGGR